MIVEQKDKRDISKERLTELSKWLEGEYESKKNAKNTHLSSLSDKLTVQQLGEIESSQWRTIFG